MILAVDVHYDGDLALIAGVAFENWEDGCEVNSYVSRFCGVKTYVPGEFYRRELPCILKLLDEHKLDPDIIVIDGFVQLGSPEKPGLGMHLFKALKSRVAVIGVAKNPFAGVLDECKILRGKSLKPLYVTSVGIFPDLARRYIRSMSGENRIPTLIKKADRLCRGR